MLRIGIALVGVFVASSAVAPSAHRLTMVVRVGRDVSRDVRVVVTSTDGAVMGDCDVPVSLDTRLCPHVPAGPGRYVVDIDFDGLHQSAELSLRGDEQAVEVDVSPTHSSVVVVERASSGLVLRRGPDWRTPGGGDHWAPYVMENGSHRRLEHRAFGSTLMGQTERLGSDGVWSVYRSPACISGSHIARLQPGSSWRAGGAGAATPHSPGLPGGRYRFLVRLDRGFEPGRGVTVWREQHVAYVFDVP